MRNRVLTPTTSRLARSASGGRSAALAAVAGVLVALLTACGAATQAGGDDIVVEFLQTMSDDATEVRKLDGSVVRGTVELYLRANDRIGEVRFFVDDPDRLGVPAHTDSEAPFTMQLDTRALDDGPHELVVATTVDRGKPPVTTHAFVVDNEEQLDDTVQEGEAETELEEDPLPAATLYVANDGDDANDGRTAATAFRTVKRAAQVVQPGDVVYLGGGVYGIDQAFTRSGTPERPIVWTSAPGEWAVFDGSGQTPIASSHKFRVRGASWNVFMNLEVRYGPQEGIYVEYAHDNVFRNIVTHGHQYSGIGNIASDRNLYERITAYDNYDDHNPRGLYGDDADGIALSSGDSNVIRQVVVYGNSDDGIDAWKSTNTVIENVIAFDNGRGSHGNGNGIKAGGASTWNNTIVRNSIAFHNRSNGFDDNSGQGILFENNTSFQNGGYSFMGGSTTTRRNNIAVGGTVGMWGARDANNTWDLGIADPLFASTDPAQAAFLSLADGSPAIGAGTGGADLGAIAHSSSFGELSGQSSIASLASFRALAAASPAR